MIQKKLFASVYKPTTTNQSQLLSCIEKLEKLSRLMVQKMWKPYGLKLKLDYFQRNPQMLEMQSALHAQFSDFVLTISYKFRLNICK
jgi:hypothetical protein